MPAALVKQRPGTEVRPAQDSGLRPSSSAPYSCWRPARALIGSSRARGEKARMHGVGGASGPDWTRDGVDSGPGPHGYPDAGPVAAAEARRVAGSGGSGELRGGLDVRNGRAEAQLGLASTRGPRQRGLAGEFAQAGRGWAEPWGVAWVGVAWAGSPLHARFPSAAPAQR